MKLLKGIAMLFLGITVASCQDNKVAKSDLKTQTDKVSYSIGLDIGKNMRKNLIEVKPEIMLQGIKDGILSDSTALLTQEEIAAVMQQLQQDVMKKQSEKNKGESEKNKKAGQDFLEKNKKDKDVKVTASGLQYKVLQSGSGKTPTAASSVTCHYKGTLIDGTEFDNSFKRGEPATFQVGGVIKGWTEALQLMKEGDKWMLFIPSELGYGDQGAGGTIPAGATLIFEVELISVK